MKTKTVEKKVYKSVLDKTVSKTVYIADDGREFNNQKEAQEYEDGLAEKKKFNEIPHVYSDLDIIPDYLSGGWFYLETIEEVKTFVNYNGGYHVRNYSTYLNDDVLKKTEEENDKILLASWVTYYENDFSDNYWSRGFYTLGYVKEKIKNFLSEIDNFLG